METLKSSTKLYRYEDYCAVSHAGMFLLDGTYIPQRFTTEINCIELPVLKVTPKGFWIDMCGFGRIKRFVLARGRKRFAHPTKEEALQAFIYRKKAQVKILSDRLASAKAALAKAKWDQERQEKKWIDELQAPTK